MANRSLGTEQNKEKQGLDALTHRLIIQALYPTCGIVSGLTVSGDGAAYKVAAGTAIVSSSETDGNRIAHFDGGDTPTVASGDASNQRIDSIYLKADDPLADDDSVAVRVGVVQGTPAPSPVAPQAPAGTLLLAQYRVPAGSTSPASSATQVYSAQQAIPYGGSLGELGESWNKADMQGSPVIRKMFYEQPISFSVPTDRLVEFKMQVCYSSDKGDSQDSQWSVQFQLDGSDIPHAAANFVSRNAWETHEFSFVTKVSAGRHTARLRTWLQHGARPDFHYSGDSSGSNAAWCGRRFMLFDRGVDRG